LTKIQNKTVGSLFELPTTVTKVTINAVLELGRGGRKRRERKGKKGNGKGRNFSLSGT